MTKLNWEQSDSFYDSGLDRGVLFTKNQIGVPWSGLISVDEKVAGSDLKLLYQDGQAYGVRPALAEFQATLSAYTSPPEFDQCDGIASLDNGLFVSGQSRKPFDLSYRTEIRNPKTKATIGYKIHILYGVYASPAARTNQTRTSEEQLIPLSWDLSTVPRSILNYKPTAYFFANTLFSTPDRISELENILYGSGDHDSRIPSVVELRSIFSESIIYDGGAPDSIYSSVVDGGNP